MNMLAFAEFSPTDREQSLAGRGRQAHIYTYTNTHTRASGGANEAQVKTIDNHAQGAKTPRMNTSRESGRPHSKAGSKKKQTKLLARQSYIDLLKN